MAYTHPPGGYPPYGAPPHQPQPGYNQPQQGPYPGSHGYSPYPQQQGYGPPPSHPPPQHPQQGYPPHQAGYNQTPPQGFPPQSMQGPPNSSYPPPQHGYGAPLAAPYPPQQGYGQQPGYGPPPPQGPYGAPPMQQAHVAPTPPSPGYVPNQIPPGDASRDADALRKAMKGFGTDEQALIRTLARLDPLQVALLRHTYQQRHGRNLESDIDSETSGYFKEGLLAIVRGPLAQDVHNLYKALAGMGTKESVLNDVLLARSNADMHAIKAAYAATYGRPLERDVRDDLSLKTERLFAMVLAGTRQEDGAPVLPAQVEADVAELHRATEAARLGSDAIAVCALVSSRSDGHLRAVAHAYEAKYRIPLEKVVQKEFSGHMLDALLCMLRAGTDRAMRDARALEETMKGMGTKDDLLVNRVVRIHWNRAHMEQVKGAYRHKYKRDLRERIKGDTKGDYERLLLAMIE